MVNITMLIISTILFTLDLSSQCSEAISAYARLVKFNLSILRVQNWLPPVVDGRRAYHTRSSRGVWARRTLAMVHTQGEHFYLEI